MIYSWSVVIIFVELELSTTEYYSVLWFCRSPIGFAELLHSHRYLVCPSHCMIETAGGFVSTVNVGSLGMRDE